MRTETKRRWRKNGKRGVSPIIATILLVAITVVLAAVLYILISGLTKGPGNTPLGTSLALGTPTDATNGTAFNYAFSVQSAGGGLVLSDLSFQVVTASGTIVSGTGLTLVVQDIGGNSVAGYNFGTAKWSTGVSTGQVSSTQTFVLTSAAVPGSLSGDTFKVIGGGSFSGSIQVSIP